MKKEEDFNFMEKTQKWDETWGKFGGAWDRVTAKDIDEMVKNGADVNHVHIEVDEHDDLKAFNYYPLELAALDDNIAAFEALRKHGAIPQEIFRIHENDKIEYRSFLQEIVSNGGDTKIVPYLVEQVKLPVTPNVLIESVLCAPQYLELLLAHFDLQNHKDVAKELLWQNATHFHNGAKVQKRVQSVIINAIKKKTTQVQNSKIKNLKSARINSER